jgi:hypothetical protein
LRAQLCAGHAVVEVFHSAHQVFLGLACLANGVLILRRVRGGERVRDPFESRLGPRSLLAEFAELHVLGRHLLAVFVELLVCALFATRHQNPRR